MISARRLSLPLVLAFLPTAAQLNHTLSRDLSTENTTKSLVDHRYTNTDAQSLIGLPMGSHKTIVDKNGNLKWSQWSLKRKPLDSPIGFSSQLDGELAIEASTSDTPLKVHSQTLYKGHYPFILSHLASGDVHLEELAFAVDPEADPTQLPTAASGSKGLDVVRVTITNQGTSPAPLTLKLSGKARNLPAHATGQSMVTTTGEDVVLVSGEPLSPEDKGLTLAYRATLQAHATRTIWLRLPYEWPSTRNAELSTLPGEALLSKAVTQWDNLWSRGARIHYPQPELNDFFDSSIAYVLILTEYDAQGDLWALDGPAVYRQYWGRGEYFQARALEVAGQLSPARQSIEHAFHIQNDDGEWDGPPTSGFPAWDNTGGNAGAVWDYFLYTRDAKWLASAYPYLLQSSAWIKAHREETQLENVANIPTGARPIKRMLTGAKCRPEIEPALKPGEKTFWYGLLPWSYGDSGLPEGHSFSHNFLAAYAVRVTAEAAKALGKTEDGAWLDQEFAAYSAAIRTSVDRALTLETTTPKYLPAQPTRPDAAYSQTFLAVWPTALYSPNDPLVTGLLTKMEKEEVQGVPTNVAWAGPAGIWAGEAMNMSEAYLLRDDVEKNKDMLLAALNHSYTTNVFKEEILTDVDKERACDTPHSKRANMEGTGDMPEAWANANVVDLLRDMLVQERGGPAIATTTLHLLAGLPAEWLPVGQSVSIADTPTTLGTNVSVKIERPEPQKFLLTVDPGKAAIRDIVVHLPLPGGATVTSVDGETTPSPMRTLELHNLSRPRSFKIGFTQ